MVSSYEAALEIGGGVWPDLQAALGNLGSPTPGVPEARSEVQDWVREGLRLPR